MASAAHDAGISDDDSTRLHYGRLDSVLNGSGLCQTAVQWKDPPPWTMAATAFLETVKMVSHKHGDDGSDNANVTLTQDRLLLEESLNSLQEVLNADYHHEIEFDTNFFETLKHGFLGDYKVEQNDENVILLGNNEKTVNDGYAVGFVRRGLPLGQRTKQPAPQSQATEKKPRSIVDHAVCLLSKDKKSGNWNVMDCFAVVEFKLSHSSFRPFPVRMDGMVSTDGFTSLDKKQHAVICQAIEYTTGSVYLSHARRGKLRQRENQSLPFAMVAARKAATTTTLKSETSGKANDNPSSKAKKDSAESPNDHGGERDTCRWVSGQLNFPKVCGNRFSFSIQSFGGFRRKGSSDDSNAVANALSLYFDTMCDGLKVAHEVQRELLDGKLSSPDPSSGLQLRFGRQDRNLKYCASPIRGANAIQGISGKEWKISQGDLFQGKLNIRMILDIDGYFLEFAHPQSIDDEDVIVKVSSSQAHTLLIHPTLTMIALQWIMLSQRSMESAVNEIGTVLYAAFPTDVGLVTVMADLTKQGYGDLRPESYFGKFKALSPLWECFAELVRAVLLPLADTVQVVHPDLRPGYDVTSNVLCMIDPKTRMPTMKLIDYESLVSFEYWVTGNNLDGRYLKIGGGWRATTFVWWQCVTIAFVWKLKLYQSSVKKRDDSSGLKMNDLRNVVLYGQQGESWLMCLRCYERATDEAGVLAVLDFLSKWFDGTKEEYFTDLFHNQTRCT